MSRRPVEWTDLLAAWVEHYSPDPPADLPRREIESARLVLSWTGYVLAADGYLPMPRKNEPFRPACTCGGRSGAWDEDCRIHGLDAMIEWENRLDDRG